MKQFLAFIAVTVAWAGICRLLLELTDVEPLAIGVVWIFGFVWMTGYIAAGVPAADLLTKRWLQMLAGFVVVSGLLVAALS